MIPSDKSLRYNQLFRLHYSSSEMRHILVIITTSYASMSIALDFHNQTHECLSKPRLQSGKIVPKIAKYDVVKVTSDQTETQYP